MTRLLSVEVFEVQVNKPRTLETLKDNIRHEMTAIQPETLRQLMKSAKNEHIRSGGDDYLRNIIFHKWSEHICTV